jgi:hypothetical protein
MIVFIRETNLEKGEKERQNLELKSQAPIREIFLVFFNFESGPNMRRTLSKIFNLQSRILLKALINMFFFLINYGRKEYNGQVEIEIYDLRDGTA